MKSTKTEGNSIPSRCELKSQKMIPHLVEVNVTWNVVYDSSSILKT